MVVGENGPDLNEMTLSLLVTMALLATAFEPRFMLSSRVFNLSK